ncbi:MFS transporter [Lacibacterium aquatile]|uniref:MFS transporter n=1 Tax=Lacibacterium aquatile TaxID=1168082 RepID=A0ABW5DNS8_9PROT
MSMQILLFYCAMLVSNLFRGLFIVTIAWGALVVSGSIAASGQIFVINQILNVVAGPGFGTLVDRLNRRFSVILGQAIVGLSTATPFVLWALGIELQFWHLALVAFCNGFGHLFAAGALDGMLQSLIPVEKRPQAASLTNGIRQASMVAGAGGGGYVIHLLGLPSAFLIGSLLCLITISCIALLPTVPVAKKARGYAAFMGELKEGFVYFRQSGELVTLALVSALGMSAGQLSNALLPGFIKLIAEGDSGLYGLVDAGWSVGGVGVAFLVGFLLRRFALKGWEYILLAGLGVTSALFSFLEVPVTLVIVHGLMGAAFSGSKILADGRLLQICREDMMGRVRANVQMATSLLGIFVYLSPTYLSGLTAQQLYFGWGVVLVLAGLGLFAARRNAVPAAQTGVS